MTHEHFGTTVVDDYEWLEDAASDETRAFNDAQRALTKAYFDKLPDRGPLRSRVADVFSGTSASWAGLVAQGPAIFALKRAPPKQQPLLVVYDADANLATERVVCDPNQIDPTGKTTIDFYVPAPNGKVVAISLSKGGSESGDLHLVDVATGVDRNETIARVNGGVAGGSVAWNADGSAFFYTRYPRAGERPEADLDFFQQVYTHKLGSPESADAYVIGKDFPRIAEIELERSGDGKAILARVANGDGGEYEHHVFWSGKWIRLSRFEDAITDTSFGDGGKIYAVSRKGAPRGKVVAFAPPYDGAPVEILGEGDAVIDRVLATQAALYVVELVSGPSRVRRLPLGEKPEPLAHEAPPKAPPKKKPAEAAKARPATPPSREAGRPAAATIPVGARGPALAELPIPRFASVSSAVKAGDDVLVRIESYVDPPAWYRYRAKEHRLVKTALAAKPPYDMSDVEVVREACTSKDGTRVPMTILKRRDQLASSDRPTYLTGYGGFGVSITPRMRPLYRVWLDHGGIAVETNLRGGGELGEAWHRAGKLTQKQNVFDDFAACAKRLVDLGYTKPERLAIAGGSNGGLLVGASLVQHPEMFRAVVARVGLYDMLRSELSPNGSFNVTEYGTVKNEAEFRALHAYSPVHNVKDGVAYPATLFLSGANDPRVDPYHSRKMTARLQAATSSDRPILLRASDGTGHGIGASLSSEIDDTTDILAFLFAELGVR